jgi:cell division transport system permease protein|tara:strand:+ start:36 stop:914 length:879 start_codon:yes stop_codon:yes gene_type:complete
MGLQTDNFFKSRVLNSKIYIFLATTLSVLIMGVLGLIAINYNSLEKNLKENISFNLILNNDIQELEIQQLIKSLSLIPTIKSVTYVSKEEAANQLKNNIGEDFIGVIGQNPLSDIIEVNFIASHITNFNPEEQKKRFVLYEEINDVIFDQNLIVLLENDFKKVGFVLLLIAVIFFIVAFILINSNIRLTIYSQRFLLKTMQLVGAKKKFIQKPFLISNLISSIIASIIGNIILVGLLLLTIRKYPEIENLISQIQLIWLILSVSIINISISVFSTWICVRKYLNLNTEELYN